MKIPQGSASRPRVRTRRLYACLTTLFASALLVLAGPAAPSLAATGSISGHGACRTGYANTSSTFSVGRDTYALTARAVYYGYQGQTLAYSPFVTFGSTYANFKRTAYSTWSKPGVSDVFWVWWEGTPATGLDLLNHIHVDCNT